MIVDHHTALYITAVTEAIEGGRTDLHQLTDICPECNEKIGMFNSDGHLIVAAVPPTSVGYMTSTAYYVVIACEGYWVVDPASVGISSPNWMPATDLPGDVIDG